MIELRKVNKYYRSSAETVHAIKDMSLKLPDRGLIFILGPSGGGKSTLLNMLGGLDQPDDGSIIIENKDMGRFTKKELNEYLNSYIGFVFQEYNILKDLNLEQNISLSLELQGLKRSERKKQLKSIIDEVELSGLNRRKLSELSGGQKQRIAIARSLIKNPNVIIADEPTGNLDSETGDKIFNLFKKLSADRLIVIVSHDSESAYRYGDRVIEIDNGELVRDSNPNFCFTDNQPLKLKDVKTPVHSSIKLSLKSMNHKKLRFLFMALICGISLAFLSFSIELSGDKLRQNIYTSVENNYDYAKISKLVKLPRELLANDYYNRFYSINLQAGEYENIKTQLPQATVYKYSNVEIGIAKNRPEATNMFFPGNISTVIMFDPTNTYDLLFGRLPNEEEKEMVITDYQAEALLYFELLPNARTMADLINQYLDLSIEKNYRIVGIIKTNYDRWESLRWATLPPADNKNNIPFANDMLIMNSVIVPKKYYDLEKTTIFSEFTINDYRGDIQINGKHLNSPNFIINTSANSANVYPWGTDINTLPEGKIALDTQTIKDVFGITVNRNRWDLSRQFHRIYDLEVTVTITPANSGLEPLTRTFKVAAIYFGGKNVLNRNDYTDIYKKIIFSSENLFTELPKDPQAAYQLFQNAYSKGYVLDVWHYQSDIDAFVVDPFIDLVAKAGLFVFAIFSIGILWTIISLEIVDTKREIGILRSLGLSGFKVSYIYIFQTLITGVIALGVAFFAGRYAIEYYNQGIMDELLQIHLSMYAITWKTPVYLVLFLGVICSAALFYPLFKIMSQKIVDVINERSQL